MEPQHVARVFAAFTLLVVWLVRREERALLHLGIAYLGLAFSTLLYRYALGNSQPPLVLASSIAMAFYVAFVWIAGEHLRGKPPRAASFWRIWAAAALGLVVVSIAWPERLRMAAALIASPVTAWTAYALWRRRQGRYRGVAALLFVQAALIFLWDTVLWASMFVRFTLAGAYSLAAAFLAYALLEESTAKIEQYASFDELTGLPNRRRLLALLRDSISKSPNQHHVAVFFVDIDGLERIYTVLGRAEGDRMLLMTAMRLRALCPAGATLALHGLREFALVVEGQVAGNREALESLGQRIVDEVHRPFGVNEVALNARVGIDLAAGGSSPEALLHRASLAATVQEAGQGWNFFDVGMQAQAERRLRIERGLREALPRREFALVYQPIVIASSRTVTKAEALLRWASPELGIVNPAEFIPIAESADMMIDIGQWVLDEACAQCARWRDMQRPGITISVNVSPVQLRSGDFVDHVSDCLARHRLPASMLELELTEGKMPAESPRVEFALARLRALGVRISIDDFGTGYSSLARLARLSLDGIKIDRSFVSDIEWDERARRLCESACSIGRGLNLQVVAEGVETEAQAMLLAQCGADYLQGYLLGRPTSAESPEWVWINGPAGRIALGTPERG